MSIAGLSITDFFTIIGLPLTIIGLILSILGIYLGNSLNLSIPGRKKYINLYGRHKLFNFSRERNKIGKDIRLIEWSVSIEKRTLRTPRVVLKFDSNHPDWSRTYIGDLFIRGDRMFVALNEQRSSLPHRSGDLDFCAIVLERPRQVISILPGFMCGYRNPIVPYCGVCLLTDLKTTPAQADHVLGKNSDIWFEKYSERADDTVDRRT